MQTDDIGIDVCSQQASSGLDAEITKGNFLSFPLLKIRLYGLIPFYKIILMFICLHFLGKSIYILVPACTLTFSKAKKTNSAKCQTYNRGKRNAMKWRAKIRSFSGWYRILDNKELQGEVKVKL